MSGHPFPFPVCVQCHLKDVLPMSVPCMLAVFPHRPHASPPPGALGPSPPSGTAGQCKWRVHRRVVTRVVLRSLTGEAPGLYLVLVLSTVHQEQECVCVFVLCGTSTESKGMHHMSLLHRWATEASEWRPVTQGE